MREKLIELLNHYLIKDVTEEIADHLIANNVVVREKGKWIYIDGRLACDNCYFKPDYPQYKYNKLKFSNCNFCPNCGADMR